MTGPESNAALGARLRAMFVEELEDQVSAANAHLLALERAPGDAEELRSLFRVMHTLKGAARAANIPEIERLCHRLEAMLASARDENRALSKQELESLFKGVDTLTSSGATLREAAAPPRPAPAGLTPETPSGTATSDVDDASGIGAIQTRLDMPREGGIRVGQDRVDTLFAASNRLLILAAQVRTQPETIETLHEESTRAFSAWQRVRRELAARDGGTARDLAILDDAMDAVRRDATALLGTAMRSARDLDRLADDVTRGVRELRMRPFSDAVADLPRAARDVAATTQKQVIVDIQGEAVQADRAVLAQLHEALLHLVRNAVDHGIESPAVRRARGKPAEGTVLIRASLVGDRIVVTIRDDGGGLDIRAIRRQLADKGMNVPADDRAVARMLFLGGVSTRDAATAISGRGVGLDAVRAAAERIRGSVDVDWAPGQGTTFTIEAPLTLATVRVILARVAGAIVAVPTAFITRLIRIRREDLRVVEGRLAVETAGSPAFVSSIASILGPPLVDRVPEGAVQLLLAQVGERRAALRVDELLEETEVVVRPIRAHGRVAVPHVSGAALLAGGAVALVLNVTQVVATALGLPGESPSLAESKKAEAPRKRVLVVDDSITTRTLEASVLEAAGYDVMTAVDGADGWRTLQERGADLVVSDVEMPRMDGLQLTEAMRASARFKETPVILVTALESQEHRARGLEVGADAYLGKSSFEQEGLLTTVRAARLMARTANKTRVLVADDSPTVRTLLAALLDREPDFEVVGEAANGAEAIERAISLSPDLIIMDVHMPIVNGLDATKEIMREAPAPILMVSASATASDVALGLSATQAGALMVLEKPHNPADENFDGEAQQFVAMARAMAAVKVVRRWGRSQGQRPTTPTRPRNGDRTESVKLIAIGTSTGGPAALHRILIDLPRDFTVPIVVVQHMARGFIDGLAQWLSANVALKVTTAAQGEPLAGGTVYIAPDDHHLGLSADGRAALSTTAAIAGFRPSVDFLFDSAARAYGPALAAVILTGMGQDGVEGLATVKDRGGRVLAQDERSSVVFGMASQAIQRGLVDEILPLDSIGARLQNLVEGPGT